MSSSKNSKKSSSYPGVVLETDKLVILKDKYGMYGDAAPSKIAPAYIKYLVDNSFSDKDDVDESFDESFESSCSLSYDELEEWKKRVQEEERLSRIYKLKHTFSLRFDNRAWVHPHGMTNFDYKSISEGKKENLEKFKNRVREENYQYLGSHPEIQAIISLAVKKLLQLLPQDPIKVLAEFFTTRMTNMKEFEDMVEVEARKISKYHVDKMRVAGQINVKPSTAVRSEISGESWRPEIDANHLKKMNIGALAQDFSFDGSSLKHKKKKSGEDQLKLNKKSKKKCGQKQYCGCKDWKLKKNQESTAVTEQDDLQTITLSTLANLNDNLLTSAEEEETVQLGDGQFFGEIQEQADEYGNLTTAEAETIAGLLVEEFLDPGVKKHAHPKN